GTKLWLIAIALVGVLVISTLAVIIYNVNLLRQFRAHPTWHVLEREMTRANAFSPLNRYLVFKDGSEDYNTQLYEWLVALEFDGAPLDAGNMRHFMANLNATQLIRLTGNFTNSPEPILYHL